jgi:hypothetical protein
MPRPARPAPINNTFRLDDPTWANACVGENGSPGYFEYARGFSSAANLMLDEVIRSRGLKHSVDYFIYPICFNMRHSIELHLKQSIIHLKKLYVKANIKLEFDVKPSHDIGIIWKFLVENATCFDVRYAEPLISMDAVISDFVDVDNTGQAFRYPHDSKEKVKHLTNLDDGINLIVLKKVFRHLENSLEELRVLELYLLDEYSLGSHTDNLSREEVLHIANLLPNRDKWGESYFSDARCRIKKVFGLSSNAFSRVTNIIENNHEMASKIGLDLGLLGLNESDLSEFLSCVLKLTPPVSIVGHIVAGPCDDFIEQFGEERKLINKLIVQLSPKVTKEYVAGLLAFQYLKEDHWFGEYYSEGYLFHLNRLPSSNEELRSEVIRLLNKPMLPVYVVYGLCFLGMNDLAIKIVKDHDLLNHFPDVENTLNGRMFELRKPFKFYDIR